MPYAWFIRKEHIITTTTFARNRLEPTVTFEDWLQRRRPQHLSTNAGAELVAFQTWRNFKEAFAPELIGRAYEETSAALGRPVRTCIDPFGGSGTTALSCQFLGVSPVTIEVNPYLSDLIEAKLSSYDIDSLIKDFRHVIEGGRDRAVKSPFPGAPATFVEPGVNDRFVFHRAIAESLARLRQRIDTIHEPANQRLLRVLLGSIALSVSNVLVSGKGRRYRRNWKQRPADSNGVSRCFEEAFVQAVYEIRRYQDRATRAYQVLRGDARLLIPTRRKFDLAVFSPPYPNSFDYTDVYNVELWVCGYLRDQDDNRKLRLSTLCSHVQIKHDFNASGVSTPTLSTVFARLDNVRSKLWHRHIPDMVSAYFADMALILDRLKRCMRSGGRVYIVVGDSQYRGIGVPVSQIVTELAVDREFKVIDDEPFRSMRASPQEGGRQELLETLLTLSRQ